MKPFPRNVLGPRVARHIDGVAPTRIEVYTSRIGAAKRPWIATVNDRWLTLPGKDAPRRFATCMAAAREAVKHVYGFYDPAAIETLSNAGILNAPTVPKTRDS